MRHFTGVAVNPRNLSSYKLVEKVHQHAKRKQHETNLVDLRALSLQALILWAGIFTPLLHDFQIFKFHSELLKSIRVDVVFVFPKQVVQRNA